MTDDQVFRSIAGHTDHGDLVPWERSSTPRVVNYGGEIYMALLGTFDGVEGLIGLVDQGGYEYLRLMDDLDREHRLFIAPRNWTIVLTC